MLLPPSTSKGFAFGNDFPDTISFVLRKETKLSRASPLGTNLPKTISFVRAKRNGF